MEVGSDFFVHENVKNIPEELLYDLKTSLPKGYMTLLTNCHELPSSKYEFILRLNIRSEEDALKWLDCYKEKSFTSWTIERGYSNIGKVVVFKKTYCCHHNTKPRRGTKPSNKNTDCPARLKITVKKVNEKSKSKDEHLKERPCEIMIGVTHNHSLRSAAALKFRKPSEEVIETFKDLLLFKGHSPASALNAYKIDLQLKHGDNYTKVAADGSVCPSIRWVYYLYHKLFKNEFGAITGGEMIHSLTKFISKYNEACGSLCASVNSIEGTIFICICDPFMKRIHEKLVNCQEIMFVDASSNMDRHNSKVIPFLCPSVAGALPLGIVLTFSETEIALTAAFKELKTLFPPKSPVQTGPNVIITDDCNALRNALKRCFPASQLWLCKFHVLQSAMRNFWNSKNGISSKERQQIFRMFQGLLYVADVDTFHIKYEEAMQSDIIRRNHFASHYFDRMRQRCEEWALCFRRRPFTRGNDTNNYSEATFRVLKDNVLRRTKAFSVVQLVSLIVYQLVDYFKRRVSDVISGRVCNITNSRYFVNKVKMSALTYRKLDDHTYIVHNTNKGSDYIVDVQRSICSCVIGMQGALCKHQCLVLKSEKLPSLSYIGHMEREVKKLFHEIVTGEEEDNSGWYDDLQPSTSGNDRSILNTRNELLVGNSDEALAFADENVDIEEVTEFCKKSFNEMFSHVERFIKSNPLGIKSVIANATERLQDCKSESAVLSIFHNFGKTSGVPPIKKGKNLQGGRNIPVQPTAVSRRKRFVAATQDIRIGDHNYAARRGRKRRAPHSLSACVESNTSLGT